MNTRSLKASGLDFRVTHIAGDGAKRVRVVVGAAGGPAAIGWMEQLYGDSRAASAVYLGVSAAHRCDNDDTKGGA